MRKLTEVGVGGTDVCMGFPWEKLAITVHVQSEIPLGLATSSCCGIES